MRGPVPTHGVAGLADIDQAALGDEQQLIEQGEDGGPRLVDGAHHRDVVPQLVTERKSGRCSSYSSFNHSSAETKRSQLGVNLGSTWGQTWGQLGVNLHQPTVRPPLARSRRAPITFWAWNESSPEVGSSRKMAIRWGPVHHARLVTSK